VTLATLVEAALLHDIGKTRIPLDVVKPGAREARAQDDGAHTLAPSFWCRPKGCGRWRRRRAGHHRSVKAPATDLGDAVPHHEPDRVGSRIYEAITRGSYGRRRCRARLPVARLAGEKLNSGLVKAFVNAITFFPLGSMVRTTRDELAIVVGINPTDPLHPMLTLVDAEGTGPGHQVDASARDAKGAYQRHIVETVLPGSAPDMTRFLAAAPAA
jgi:hypothetical protein